MVLILEKVDAMTLEAMVAGDETADFDVSRDRLMELLNAPLEFVRRAGPAAEDAELRQAIGLGA